jgi:mycothiol synthase
MTVAAEPVLVPEAPSIPALTFRRLRLPDDLEPLALLFNAANEADGVEDRNDAAGLAEWFAHPSGYDPLRDCLIAQVGDRVVGYGKVHWVDDVDGGRDYASWGAVDPEWRRRGLGRAILRASHRRLREIAATQDVAPDVERRFETWAAESQIGAIALIESEGFTVARYFFEMLRPNLGEGMADFPLPEGIEVRPMRPEHYRQVWEAGVEAFADHWGGIAEGEEMFQRYFGGPSFEPDIWRVAWDGDQVAGSVSNVVMREFNQATGARRGLLSGVSVRRPWRGRGLARALVSQSLVALRDRGMSEAVLGVDADNPTGALGVYEANGFVVHTRERSYRKLF